MVRDGYWYAISLLLVATVVRFFTADWIASWLLVAVPVLLAAFFLWFFRDPEKERRKQDGDANQQPAGEPVGSKKAHYGSD